jgi:chromodomain-helicase-DNA-binding protein 1
MMPSPSGHRDSLPYTNGHASPLAVHVAHDHSSSAHSDSGLSDDREPAAPEPSSDVDAPGEEDDDEQPMAADSDSSADEDAEGEPDGDYDSDSPPSEHAPSSRAQSVSSQESSRPLKRKASSDKDDYMTRDPELYGLRRSVSASHSLCKFLLTVPQGRARPSRRIVSNPGWSSASILTRSRSIVMTRTTRTARTMIQTLTSLASVSAQPRAKVRMSLDFLSPLHADPVH